MKKIFVAIASLATCLMLTQCKDYLSVSSPNKSDDVFVTSSVSEAFKTLAFCYSTIRSAAGGGNYNWNDVAECEYYPEYNSNNGRIGYLQPTGAKADDKKNQFNNLYTVIARCSRIAAIIAEKDEFKNANGVNDWTQLYGEAKTMWAYSYLELVRHFGDVPFGIENSIVEEYGLTSRFDILDACIAALEEAEKYMYNLGQGGIQAERMSRTFAIELLGECALYAGGYQTIRTDVSGLYGNLALETKYDNTSAKASFARRTDWKNYYQKAQSAFRKVIGENKGTLVFITSDDRSYADNPFQRHFQYIHDMQVSPESIFEISSIQNQQTERPYSQGRPSDGATKNAAPCKIFGGVRINPVAYYTAYEDGDKRWDASAVVTGSDGKGNEAIVNFTTGSRLSGGISTNKWDVNKMAEPYVVACRKEGLNYAFYRISITMLQLAEVDAALGEKDEALKILNQLRDRSGLAPLGDLSGDALIKAVVDEYRRETLGEGNLKYAEIRTGLFTEIGKAMRVELKKMIAGLEADGFYTFSNGRTISNYVWTKQVKLDNPLTYDPVPGNPALTPGWRGVFDYTKIPDVAGVVTGTNHNLAIEGLFEKLDDAKIAALEADGYAKTKWAVTIIDGKNTLFDYNMLSGIDLSDVPLYYHPIPLETIQQSKGNVSNGYGLPQQ